MIGKRLNVLAIGFAHDSFAPSEKVAYMIINNHINPADEAVSGREQYATLVRLVKNADLIFIKTKNINFKNNLEEYEVILLHLAYSNRTPIIGVGSFTGSLMRELICNEVDDIKMAEAYLEEFYV